MSKIPDALKIAKMILSERDNEFVGVKYSTASKAAKELERLHAENEALQQKVYALESSEKALRAQLSTKDLLVQSLREENEALRLNQEVARLEKLCEGLDAQIASADTQIAENDATIARLEAAQKLREALIAGDGEAAARIMGGDDQARGAQ